MVPRISTRRLLNLDAGSEAHPWRGATLCLPALQRAAWVLRHAQHEPLLQHCIQALLSLLQWECTVMAGSDPSLPLFLALDNLVASGLLEATHDLLEEYTHLTRSSALDWEAPPGETEVPPPRSFLRTTHCQLALRLADSLVITLSNLSLGRSCCPMFLLSAVLEVLGLGQRDEDAGLVAAVTAVLTTMADTLPEGAGASELGPQLQRLLTRDLDVDIRSVLERLTKL